MIENPPKNTKSSSQNIIDILIDPQNQEQFQKIEKDYLYWDKAKYYKPKIQTMQIFGMQSKYQE